MKTESGRTLIEIIGVLAITGVMTASAIGIYNSIRNNQHNTIAAAELRELAKNVNLLMGNRSDYTGISVDYLVKSGAIKSEVAPIGKTWSVEVGPVDVTTFEIKLHGLSHNECDFFAAAVPAWAEDMFINGTSINGHIRCLSASENDITFIAR